MPRLLSPSLALAAAAAGLVVHAAPAAANPYESWIDIETEDDLADLYVTQQIDELTYDTLRALLDRGLDLSTASREELYSLPNLTYDDVDAILEYRSMQGFIADPSDLVKAGALTERKLLAISAFLIVAEQLRSAYQPHGMARAFMRASQNDDTVPSIGLRSRFTAGRRITVGAAAVVRRLSVGEPSWDPNRGGFVVDAAGPRPHVAKLYARYRGDHFDVIAGSYRIGFGQRLTFDTALAYTPNGIYVDDQLTRSYDLARSCRESTGELPGSPCVGELRYDYVSPDYGWSDGLRGVAAGFDHLAVGDGWLQAYGWTSLQSRGIYQYELVDRGACADPRDDEDPACAAPAVYVRPDGDPLAPAAAASYQTLPDVFAEALAGANLTYFARQRAFVGATGYAAAVQWLTAVPDGVELDFQEWSRFPIGGRYGAAGVNAGYGHGDYDLFAEVTHSFDRIPDGSGPIHGGGGPAALVRATYNHAKTEIELSARYYDPDFVNPYAGSIAQGDEVEGQRARGEHGLRLKFTTVDKQKSLRAGVDVWRSLAGLRDEIAPGVFADDYLYVGRVDVYGRADVNATDQVRWGLWLRYQDKGLNRRGVTPCYEVDYFDGELGEPLTCLGNKLTTTARLRLTPDKKLTVLAQAQHELLDDSRYDHKRSDLSGWVSATWRADPRTTVRGRVLYRYEDISDNTHLEQRLHTYLEYGRRLRAKDRLRVRGDLMVWLDDRDSTLMRTPSPELWLGLDYEARF